MKIEESVYAILAEKLSLDVEKISRDSHLVDDLGLDSLGAVEMIFDLESIYDIQISDADMQSFNRTKDIIDYLTNCLRMKIQ